jgi:hypothetical protein
LPKYTVIVYIRASRFFLRRVHRWHAEWLAANPLFSPARQLWNRIPYVPGSAAYGHTEFYTLSFGKNLTKERQAKRFPSNDSQAVLATTRVRFASGEIDVMFWLVRGVLFKLEYRSPQRICYPPREEFRIEDVTVSIPGVAAT